MLELSDVHHYTQSSPAIYIHKLGEDPYLGATLIQPVVSGIQGQGVIATMKHYINNNQVLFSTTVHHLPCAEID